MLDTTSRVDPASLFDGSKPLCDQCGKPFEPRSGSGGKPQRFCSSECRTAFHNEPQRGQRNPTCIAQNLPAVLGASAATGRPPEPVEPPTPEPAPEPAGEDDSADYCWAVPSQASIECSLTNDDEIEIEQISPIHEDENIRIDVARSNAVRLARCILWAAGFKSVLIATGDGGGGYRDVEDGDLPEHFAGRP
jgi:hypothetical protein